MKKIPFNQDWTLKNTCLQEENLLEQNQNKKITLPHDAMQEQGRTPDAPSGAGGAFYLGGTYIYEKIFPALEEWKNQDVILEFEIRGL